VPLVTRWITCTVCDGEGMLTHYFGEDDMFKSYEGCGACQCEGSVRIEDFEDDDEH
jgi:DnaJ-class molecular chaperone